MRGLLFAAAMLMAAPPLSAAGDNGEGEGLFEARCALCHQLPDPRQFKADQWQKVLAVMQKRMAQKGMEPFTEEEKASIFGYLSHNARR